MSEWMGSVPKRWNVVKIKRCISHFQYGISDPIDGIGRFKVITMGEVRSGKVHIPAYGNLNNIYQDFILNYGDILYNRTNSLSLLGKVGVFTGDKKDNITFSSYLVRLVFNTNNNCFYFNYQLNCINFLSYIQSNAYVSINQSNLNPNRYKEFYIVQPPLSEQQAIANFLDKKSKQIDSYIKQKQKMLGLLENQKTAIINNEIPGDFELRKLKDITLKIGSGSTPLGGEKVYTDSGVILLRSQNIGWGYILTDNLVYISDEIDSQMSKTRVMAGDILLNITGFSMGRCCIVPDGFPQANFSQNICIIRPNPRYISPEYLIKVFLSEFIQSQIKLHSKGATRKGLDFERVGNFLVPVPVEAMKKPQIKYMKLGDLVKLKTTLVTPDTHNFSKQFYIGVENIESNTGKFLLGTTNTDSIPVSPKYLFSPGDILISKIRPYLNKVMLADFKGICSADIYVLEIDKTKACVNYILSLLKSEFFLRYACINSMRAVIPKINSKVLLDLHVPCFRVSKQQAIANFLDTKTSNINNYLKSKSSELTNLVDSKTHTYNSINNDYKTTRLKYVATIIPGKSLSNKPVLNNPQQVNVVSFKKVLDDNIVTSGLQSGNVSSNFLVKNKLEYNDVLITGEGDYHLLGRSGLFKNKANNYVAGAGVYVIRVNQALIDPDFLSIYIRTTTCKNYFSTHNLAAYYPPHISLTDLKNLPVPLMPLPDQKQIAATVKSKISKINSCINLVQSQIELMEEYRKSLIFEAVTGKLAI